MIQTPVGIRCKECAQLRKLPPFDVTPAYYARAAVTGGVVGIGAGILWGLLLSALGFFFFLPWIIALGIGYAVGEAISMASNRKRGTGLAVVAGVSMALAVGAAGSIIGFRFFLGTIWGLLLLAVAFYVAISRLR